ncbi:MAG: dihydrodipicolinate synthase family protein [Acidobacteriota bacterium]|nr:MAG: dihydrodipicolinate synthase family protein [Acidobacteriota bacterium]
MNSNDLMSGVLAPVVTPFAADLTPGAERFLKHCRWLQDQNCGLAVFGTNSEANSLSVRERTQLLDMLIEQGVNPKRMMPGTGCCSIVDSVTLTKHALAHGVGGVLMLPPFYYKGVSDEGLYRTFAEIIERVGDDRLRIYLYHFPQMSQVPLGIELVGRLRESFPGIIVGMKDSSGDPDNLNAVLSAFPGFGYFAGNETLLLANMRAGGVGCISATANVNPEAIDRLFQNWQSDDADSLQSSLNEVRGTVQQFPLVPALKKIISHYASDPEWNRLRPPLVELADADGDKLMAELDALGFEMQGLRG